MDSPSRNPLLLDQTNDYDASDDESNEETAATRDPGVSQTVVKERLRRNPSTPTDQLNFAYISFYILGM